MPYKDPETRKRKHKEYSRKHYEANTAEIIKKTADKKRQLKAEWVEFKASLACSKCGFNHPAALDFHHEDPSQKDREVSYYLKNGQFAKAYEEIKKCIILCANCHRVHHHQEKQEKKNPTF